MVFRIGKRRSRTSSTTANNNKLNTSSSTSNGSSKSSGSGSDGRRRSRSSIGKDVVSIAAYGSTVELALDDGTVIVPTITSCAKKGVLVRTSSICNSENLNRLHREMRRSDSTAATANTSSTSSPSPSAVTNTKKDDDPWSPANLQEAIDLWQLNEEEITRLQELQHSLKDCAHHYKYDPHIILRYMTSPLGKEAEPLFRKMVQWRIDNNIDSVLDEYKPDPILLDYNCTAILKDYDYEGDPIYVERGGMTDGHGMLKRFSKDELMDFAIYTRELNTQGAWIGEYEQRQGRKVKGVTVVYDLKGMNASHLNPAVLGFFGQVMTLNSEKYPGPLKRMIIIRAPAIFRLAWSVAKNFFPQSSRDKMVFAGKHPEKILAKFMDLKVLPACICDGGEGEAATGLPPKMEGGVIPDHRQPLRSNNNKAYHSQNTFLESEHESIASSAETSLESTI